MRTWLTSFERNHASSPVPVNAPYTSFSKIVSGPKPAFGPSPGDSSAPHVPLTNAFDSFGLLKWRTQAIGHMFLRALRILFSILLRACSWLGTGRNPSDENSFCASTTIKACIVSPLCEVD